MQFAVTEGIFTFVRMENEKLIYIKTVSPTDPEVIKLIELLNQYQIGLYGIKYCTLESPEQLLKNKAFMLGAFFGATLAGIGGIKLLDTYAEIKRMYITEDFRGAGIADQILHELEEYAWQNNIRTVRLETGTLHHSAQRLYERRGYTKTERFGDYPPNPISVFYEKRLLDNEQINIIPK
jgi:putative acetyltransferase